LDCALKGDIKMTLTKLKKMRRHISRRKNNMQMSKSEYRMWKDYLNEEIKKKLDK
jgi:hypothetical protein